MDSLERVRQLRKVRVRVRRAIQDIDEAIACARLFSEGVVDRLPAAKEELVEYEKKVTISIDLIERYGACTGPAAEGD